MEAFAGATSDESEAAPRSVQVKRNGLLHDSERALLAAIPWPPDALFARAARPG